MTPTQPSATPEPKPITSLNAEEAERMVDEFWKPSATPMTDAATNYCDANPVMPWVDADHARALETELAEAKAELVRFKESTWEHDEFNRKHAVARSIERDNDKEELARLRAENERLKELSDNAASAMQWAKEEFAAMKVRAERAESALALYRSKVFRMKSILTSIDDDGKEQHTSATAERAEAEVLAQAELLGRSAEREADLMGKLSRAEHALSAARKDSERLDWLERNVQEVGFERMNERVLGGCSFDRNEIDAAMTKSKNT